MKSKLYIITVLLLVTSCAPEPKPISYGTDDCTYCKMTIADNRYGAEFVTDKGKVYKFDAIECMADYVNKNETLLHSYLLVNTFDKPNDLISTKDCIFLISNELPSPMGAYLTAFSDKMEADNMRKVKSGSLYSWNDILNQRKKD